jgi:Xaa-Pro dipeptidase
MLTAEGCSSRRKRFIDRLRPTSPIVLTNPVHLCYFANYYVEPISQHADFGALLAVEPDGRSVLFHDSKMPKTIDLAHVDERKPITWYTGQEPGRGPRGMLLRSSLQALGGRIHDSIADPIAQTVFDTVAELRRQKDPDELELLKTCMRATEAGHAWGRANIKPGLTELDVYTGVSAACEKALGHWAVVYGDFTVTNGTRRGGPPTPHVLKKGETFILDFSVIVQGYRSDFTNTLVVGGDPSPEQRRLFGLCVKAMEAGEKKMAAGVPCQSVYDAIRGVFDAEGLADHFPTHAGHGLGISHPESPFIVRHSNETLLEGDVVTLEPGLYINDIGIRIEHNYLITKTGFERLSNHTIALA